MGLEELEQTAAGIPGSFLSNDSEVPDEEILTGSRETFLKFEDVIPAEFGNAVCLIESDPPN